MLLIPHNDIGFAGRVHLGVPVFAVQWAWHAVQLPTQYARTRNIASGKGVCLFVSHTHVHVRFPIPPAVGYVPRIVHMAQQDQVPLQYLKAEQGPQGFQQGKGLSFSPRALSIGISISYQYIIQLRTQKHICKVFMWSTKRGRLY
jgi:hypothetical protein